MRSTPDCRARSSVVPAGRAHAAANTAGGPNARSRLRESTPG